MKIKLIITDENKEVVFRGNAYDLPVQYEEIKKKSIELFDDDEPCIIHQSYAIQKLMDGFLKQFQGVDIHEKKFKDFTGVPIIEGTAEQQRAYVVDYISKNKSLQEKLSNVTSSADAAEIITREFEKPAKMELRVAERRALADKVEESFTQSSKVPMEYKRVTRATGNVDPSKGPITVLGTAPVNIKQDTPKPNYEFKSPYMSNPNPGKATPWQSLTEEDNPLLMTPVSTKEYSKEFKKDLTNTIAKALEEDPNSTLLN